MFCGMIAPEKPPLRIANSASSFVTLRLSRLGPVGGSPAIDPSRARRLQRVAAGAALGEELRPAVVDLDALGTAAGGEAAAASTASEARMGVAGLTGRDHKSRVGLPARGRKATRRARICYLPGVG